MHREHHRPGQRREQLHESFQALAPIDVAGPMRGYGQVAARLEAEIGQDGRALARDLAERHRYVGHHVPDEVRLPSGRLALQIPHRGLRGAEQQIARVVGEQAVELLRHRAIEGAHAGLHVPHRHGGLGRRERPGERAVGVAVDEHEIGRQLGEHRLEGREDASRLRRVRATAGAQLALGRRHGKLLEEDPRKLVVVVLAGVHDRLLEAIAQDARHGGGLNELRPIADDRDNPHRHRLRNRPYD